MPKRKYQEKDFQTDFGRWIHHGDALLASSGFELKVTATDSIPFSDVREHQIDALMAAKTSRMFWKIPDDSMAAKPFDCFLLVASSAWVVVMFRCRERGQKEFFLFDVEVWVAERKRSVRRSLTEERARQIGLRQRFR